MYIEYDVFIYIYIFILQYMIYIVDDIYIYNRVWSLASTSYFSCPCLSQSFIYIYTYFYIHINHRTRAFLEDIVSGSRFSFRVFEGCNIEVLQ